MAVVLVNNAVSRLASSLTSGATSLSVTAGEGAKFPAVGGGDWFPVTLVKATGALEIVRCTARSGDILTIARAQEGTAAQAFSVGDRVELRLTAAALADIVQMITNLSNAALLDANNLSDLQDVPTSRFNLGLGTAATANMVVDGADTTAGRALKYGSFGLGKTLPLGTQDLNSVSIAGFHSQPVDANATLARNYPVAAAGTLINNGLTDGTLIQSQIYIVYNTGEMYVRSFYNGTAFPWRKVLDTGNVPIYSQFLIASSTAAAARSVLNAPLGVDKQMCKAWVNFQGTGTVTIRDSYNVSSVTDNGAGDYTINYTSALATNTYSVSGTGSTPSGGGATNGMVVTCVANSRTTASQRIYTLNNSSSPTDAGEVSVQVIGS